MLGRLFAHFRREAPEPLTGAPRVRRSKTYSAQSGYVYQYVYLGRRKRADGTEFVFDVTADRKNSFAVSVLLPDEALRGWERRNKFVLRDNERHGIAKMALFQAFDERSEPGEMRHPILVRRADLDIIVEALHIL